jgi:cytochrome c oxidase subunit 2
MQWMLDMMPIPASEHAAAIDETIVLVHWLMLVLFVGWGGFFAFTLFRFRRSRNPKADPVGVKGKFSTWSEIGVAVVEAVLLIGFSIPLWANRVDLDHFPSEDDSIVVRVVAQQFAWNIWYAGEDGIFGESKPELVDETNNPVGLDRANDPAAKDDITTINQLHLPVNKPAIIHLSSKDVIHSFNLPQMRIKQDVIPGLKIPLWFTPIKTTEQVQQETGNPEFTYEIACAQLCGNSHYSMRGYMTIHDAAGFDAWLEDQKQYLPQDDDFFDF